MRRLSNAQPSAAGWSGSTRGSCHRLSSREPVAPQPHGGVLADVQPLTLVKQLHKRRQVSLQVHAAQQAAQLHLLLLALRVAAPVKPAQAFALQGDGGSLGAEGSKVQLRGGSAQVHVAQQLAAPRQGHEHIAGGELPARTGLPCTCRRKGVQKCSVACVPSAGAGGKVVLKFDSCSRLFDKRWVPFSS